MDYREITESVVTSDSEWPPYTIDKEERKWYYTLQVELIICFTSPFIFLTKESVVATTRVTYTLF